MSVFGLRLCIAICAVGATPGLAGELKGPGRFCGYSPIIDLIEGERIETTYGGIHGGGFIWFGRFGQLEVDATGLAAKPKGRVAGRTSKGMTIFKERREEQRFTVALWNGDNGAAYFRSNQPITPAQKMAIDRVALFQESLNESDKPQGCDLRTVFSWE